MYANERWQMILQLLEKHDFLTVTDLTDYIPASPATLRRDIITLNERNLIQKVHGGIKPCKKTITDSTADLPAKDTTAETCPEPSHDIIIKKAVSVINDNDCIFISCGIYTFPIINAITHQNVTIVTDFLPNIFILNKPNLNFYFLEGDIDLENRTIIFSPESIEKLSFLNFSKVFFHCDAIDKDMGFTTSDILDFKIKSVLCKRPGKHYALVGKNAFNKHYLMSYALLSELTVLSDHDIPDDFKSIIKTI